MNKLIFVLAAFCIALHSCSKTEEKMTDTLCDGTEACTEILMTLTVKVVDREGNPASLSRIKVTRLSNGEDLTRQYAALEWGMMQSAGSYPIASDLDDRRLPRHRNIPLRFQGYIGDKEVVNAEYQVAFDCCHIKLVSGERELVVR